MKLNLGCGKYKKKGWINIDNDKAVNPDVVCDATSLPYSDGVIDEIYVGHFLEHFTLNEGLKALKYWRGLLKPGGKIYIAVPDFKFLSNLYLEKPTFLEEFNDVYIFSYLGKGSRHKACYDMELLKKQIVNAGFKQFKEMKLDHKLLTAQVEWQIGMEAIK